ncbi:MAG: rhomboid family intramembrane serine protease [Spirochaetaceae bacterium]|nr:rhomboid family intramembrane serine protease [Spirochaetaceae bacterium]
MTLYIIALYFSLMFSLISIIRLIPFTRSNRNTLILRFILGAANILSVLFLSASYRLLPVMIIIVTIIFTEGSELLKKYISKHFNNLIQRDSILLKLNLLLTFNTNAFGFLQMAKAAEAFERNDDILGEEILSAYSKKVRNDLSWLSNCLLFLMTIHRNKMAFSLVQSIEVNLKEPHIPYPYVHIAIQLYCDNRQFELAELYLDYMESHYYDAQHKYSNIRAFLYYYATAGKADFFNKMIEDFPEIRKFPLLPEWENILLSTDKESSGNKEAKLYQFNLTAGAKGKMYPLYVFAGIICLVTLLQLVFSKGGTWDQRLISGFIFPIEYIKYGASVKNLILRGEWIRLVTPIFLHGGLLHLAMNLFGLINLGRLLLRFFDKFLLLFIFFAGAVIGNVLSLFFSSALLSVGASGGVFSLLGALFLYLLWYRKEINKAAFHRIIVNFAVILAIQILFGLQNRNIDNWAHLGGFLGGTLFTGLSLGIKNTAFQRHYLSMVKVILFLLTASVLFFWPRIFNQNQFVKWPLVNTVSEPNFEYSIPSTWEKEGDRYIDLLSNAQILFYTYDGFYELDSQIEAIKELYTRNNKYLFFKDSLKAGHWRSLEFISNEDKASYNLYYFCSKSEKRFREIYLFLDPYFSDDYFPFFETVLSSVK